MVPPVAWHRPGGPTLARYQLDKTALPKTTDRYPLRHCDLSATHNGTKEEVDASYQYTTSE
jgi:hypothetical protein